MVLATLVMSGMYSHQPSPSESTSRSSRHSKDPRLRLPRRLGSGLPLDLPLSVSGMGLPKGLAGSTENPINLVGESGTSGKPPSQNTSASAWSRLLTSRFFL